MLYLLDKDVRTVKWNGIPLHEASSAIVKEEINGDFTLTIRYPITDLGIYQLIKEDMLIKAPVPVLGAQLFRIKKPVENDDSLDITAYHISDDVMQRSIIPLSVVGQGCAMALSQMVQNTKTDLGTFSFTSDIMDGRTFNTTETETLYSVLLDGKHSIVGTWEGELVRDNFAVSIKRSRGTDRGVVITTHKNLKSYQWTKNSQSVVTRIHAKSTFKAEGTDEETTITVTVDSPLIGNYPYINEKDYENNNAKTVDELRKWAEAKFKNEGIDKISDAIEIEAYELDGQVIHLGDTVNIKSRKHNVDIHKKAIAYEYNALTEEYISITFDDKPGIGGTGVASGVSNAADVILNTNRNAQEVAIERAVKNANQAFEAEFDKRVEEINDGIEQSRAEAERHADNIKRSIDTEITQVNQSMQAQSEERDRQVADILSKTQSVESLANQAKSDAASALARANQVKTEAIADARAQVATVSQALNTAKSELQTAIASADQKARDSQASATALRNDLNLQASKILEQARAQTALTNRVTSVETLADGTRSTVAELSRTMQEATQNIASVSSRTRAVEDTLSQTRTQYEALTQTVNAQTGQIESINRKTADLQSGIDGVTERFESLRIEDNLLLNSSFNENLNQWQRTGVTIVDGKARIIGELNKTKYIYQSIKSQIANDDVSQVYIASISVKVTNYVAGSINPFLALYISGRKNDSVKTWFGATYLTAARLEAVNNRGVVQFTTTFKVNVPRSQIGSMEFNIYARDFTGEVEFEKVSLRRGDIDLGWQASPEDLRSEIASYKRTADEASAELSRQIQLADGKAVDAKTYAQQTATAINTRLESLETYKNAEGARVEQYLTASREETARQLTAERTAIATNYVAKSTYDENVRGTTLKLNEIKTTADTAKQNLAVYQNTVDRKLEELTSSTQTLDGKINTASAKVDTVAGQIRTEISEVEGKIPTAVGSQNLLLNSSDFVGWTKYGSGATIADSGYNNSKAVVTADASYNGYYANNTKHLPLELNTNYVTSCWVFVRKRPTSCFIGFNNVRISNLNDVSLNKWVRVSKVFNTGASTSAYTSNGVFYLIASGGDVLFSAPKLETGTIPTDYSVAQRDIINELSSVKTTITQTASGVEQLSTSLSATNSKVTTAETNIRQLVNDVSSKVSQTDYNTLTGRVDSAETAITQNATEISKRLTSTQVESAITGKGYQTKSQVDDNITGRGYITNSALQPYALSTTVQNLVQETADSFSRTISRVENKIPTKTGVTNLLGGTSSDWKTIRVTQYNSLIKSYNPQEWALLGIKTGDSVTFSVDVKTTSGKKLRSRISFYGANTHYYSEAFVVNGEGRLSVTGVVPDGITSVRLFVDANLTVATNTGVTEESCRREKLEIGAIATDWSPAPEDLATVTALHSVRDTVDSHTRTIGAVGTTGSILDNVSKVTQTAAGLVQEVSGTNGLKTQVSTLAGSYAIKSLTKAGDVLGQINLNKDGSIKIDGSLVQITGKTYIQDGVITSAKIGSLDAGKITSGYLSAARIATNSIDGSKMVFDQAFVNKMTANEALFKQLFAKNAFITSVQAVTLSASQITGGLMRATNRAMEVNLNAGQILYYTDQAALKRVLNGYPTQFVKFATGTVTGKGNAGVTVIGSNRWNSESSNDGGFVGIRAWNGANIDQIDVVGDTVRLASSTFESADGWTINTLPGKLDIDAFNSSDRPSSRLSIGDVKLFRTSTSYVSLMDVLHQFNHNFKHLQNITGRGDVILTWDTIK